MKKIISLIGMFAVLGVAAGDARGVAMNANIRRLLQEKQDKIAKLEECEGKKQGWMIAGISTIGLTAVGVGVNIAQASKSNRLSDEIEMEKTTLQRQQDELDRISNQIADERAKQAQQNDGGNGQSGGGGGSSVSAPAGGASATGKKCDCSGCKQSLTIGDTKYTCGNNASEGAFAMSTWFYICDDGCWKGPDTIDYRGIEDCDMVVLPNIYSMRDGTVLYFGADVVAGSEYYGTRNICKKNYNGSVAQGNLLDTSVDGIDDCYVSSGMSLGYDECTKNLTGDVKWGVVFPYGTVYGTSVCNGNVGTHAQVSSTDQSNEVGLNCWCKMTGPYESRWVFRGAFPENGQCSGNCAYGCAIDIEREASFRKALFDK